MTGEITTDEIELATGLGPGRAERLRESPIVADSADRAVMAWRAASALADCGMRAYPPVADPRDPDTLVFGDGYRLGAKPRDLAFTVCGPCDLKWQGDAACWVCGKPGEDA